MEFWFKPHDYPFGHGEIEELKCLLDQEFGGTHTIEEARDVGIRLLTLYDMLASAPSSSNP